MVQVRTSLRYAYGQRGCHVGLEGCKRQAECPERGEGRIGVAERAKEIERKRDNWMKIWDDSQPGFSSAGFNPFLRSRGYPT